MGFWIFLLIMELLIPFTMIGIGRSYMKKPPKKINSVTGYRTSMSMKNRTTWEFAHKYCGRIWYICGIILLPLSIVFMCLVMGEDKDTIGNAGLILCAVQMIFLAAPVIPTEMALKKNFDKNGRRRQIPVFRSNVLFISCNIKRDVGKQSLFHNIFLMNGKIFHFYYIVNSLF